MRIGRALEKEQALGAVVERDGDGYQRALAGGEYSTGRTEDDVTGDIGEGGPI